MTNRNNGNWSDAKFYSFIKNGLRSLSLKWPPRNKIKKDARTTRGKYKCNGWKRNSHVVPCTLNKRANIFVDHVVPIIDRSSSVRDWNEIIDRMFCEEDNLQLLCKVCHDKKTSEENKKEK